MSGAGRELALGARLALAGGRGAWTRVAMTAVGVGLGVALLLFAASVPQLVAARDERTTARDDLSMTGTDLRRGADTLLVAFADTDFRDVRVRGRVLQPEGPRAPVPPGVGRLPGPGELVVSPRLRGLLTSPEGALLRARLDARIVGTIADAGLEGPGEYVYYAGADDLRHGGNGVHRIDRFGSPDGGDGLHPVLRLLVVIAFAVLLLPVLVFIGAAVRFGGEDRDRRLAALRLVGADSRMVRRIAAGEALLGALLGLAAGGAIFLFARRFAERVTLSELSAFTADVRPSAPLAVLIAVAVPAAAVAVTQLALRSIAIEPLGVVRRAQPRRRRVWWRLLPPLAGIGLLVPLLGVEAGATFDELQVAAGVVLLLIGVTAILPWLVEAVVHRLGRGGGVAWQLATRRLQLDSGLSARVVSGIAVAVAGAIALQTLFSGVERSYTTATGADLDRAQAFGTLEPGRDGPHAGALAARLRTIDGVTSVVALDQANVEKRQRDGGAHITSLTVADCRTLRELAVLRRCADGDAFAVRGAPGAPRAGDRVRVGGRIGWTVPPDAPTVRPRQDPAGGAMSGVLLTPKAAAGLELPQRSIALYTGLDPARPDAIEHVRNATALVDPRGEVMRLTATRADRDFANIRRGLFVGAVAVLLLIGASMLVNALEQLRERRRLLAALVAFGTPRTTLGWSVFWQTAVPVALGLALAVVTGAALGALLLTLVGEPLRVNLVAIAGMTAIGAAVVLLVTVASLPLLWRLMRPDGLRTE